MLAVVAVVYSGLALDAEAADIVAPDGDSVCEEVDASIWECVRRRLTDGSAASCTLRILWALSRFSASLMIILRGRNVSIGQCRAMAVAFAASDSLEKDTRRLP